MAYDKHHLAFQHYEVKLPGSVQLPAEARWVVRKHVGGGEFMDPGHKGGEICLILQDTWEPKAGHWPVMSFLSAEEALELSEQLRLANESG